MPPKRNPRDQGKGKGKQTVVEVEPFNPCDELKPMALVPGHNKPVDELDEETKGIFMLQIDDCQEKLTFFQRRADELDVKAQFYPQLFDQMDLDKKDLSSYLENCLKEKEDTLDAMKRVYEMRTTEKEEQDVDQGKQLEDARKQIEEMKQQMSDENVAMQMQLASLKSVDQEKQEINDEISLLNREFEQREADNKEQIYQQERNATIEVERLRRSANAHIGTVAEECTIAAGKQLKATVKQCTIDSVRATALIAEKYSDDSISRLLTTNDALRHRTEENQRLIEVLEANLAILKQDELRQHELTENLIQKTKGQECLDLDFRYQQTNREMLRGLKLMKDYVDDERKNLVSATDRRQDLQKDLDKVNSESKSTAIACEDLNDTLTAATPGLKEILPTSNADLLRKLETLASEVTFKRVEPSEAPPCPRRQQRLRQMKRKTTQKNCITKPK